MVNILGLISWKQKVGNNKFSLCFHSSKVVMTSCCLTLTFVILFSLGLNFSLQSKSWPKAEHYIHCITHHRFQAQQKANIWHMDFTKVQYSNGKVCLSLPTLKLNTLDFRPKSCLIGLFLIISVGIHLGLVVAVMQINYYIHPTPR